MPVVDHMQLDPTNVIAMGDYLNEIETERAIFKRVMVRLVAHSIRVKNGLYPSKHDADAACIRLMQSAQAALELAGENVTMAEPAALAAEEA